MLLRGMCPWKQHSVPKVIPCVESAIAKTSVGTSRITKERYALEKTERLQRRIKATRYLHETRRFVAGFLRFAVYEKKYK